MEKPYCTDAARAANILRCLAPWRIVVNVPPYIDADELTDSFKEGGFNVLTITDPTNSGQRRRLRTAWEAAGQTPAAIIGCFESVEIMSEIFPGTYSYVYMFPNSTRSYLNAVLARLGDDGPVSAEIEALRKLRHAGDTTWKGEFEAFVKQLAEKNRSIYKEHCEVFENKVFTVLV